MHQTRKGQQWYFGVKLHIGVDSQSGLTYSAVVTAANVHDKHPLPDLLHGQERCVYGDSAYASQKELIQGAAPNAKDFTNQRTRRNGIVDEVVKLKNHSKSRIRERVEPVFGVVKRLWGFGNPVHSGGFDGHGVDAAGLEPVDDGVEVDREAGKLAQRFIAPIRRRGHKMGCAVDVNAGGVGVGDRQGRSGLVGLEADATATTPVA